VKTAFHDLPSAAFPLTMSAYRTDNGEQVWREVVDRPGSVRIPPLAAEHGVLVRVRIELANGEVQEAEPGE
jgi:hypothetical protein